MPSGTSPRRAKQTLKTIHLRSSLAINTVANTSAPTSPVSTRLAGKVAVVTGASKGIGAAIARHRAGAERVVADIQARGGSALAAQANVSQAADIERLFAEAVAAFGPIDILVNNAGIYLAAPLGAITVEHFHRQFDLNVLGLILTTQEAIKHFNPAGGSIINTSSVVSTLSPANVSVYAATKSAVDGLTRSFAKELGARRIRVNSINPGLVETEGLAHSGVSQSKDAVASITPLGRIGRPDDIAPAAVYLASDESSWVTGETHYIAGGLHG